MSGESMCGHVDVGAVAVFTGCGLVSVMRSVYVGKFRIGVSTDSGETVGCCCAPSATCVVDEEFADGEESDPSCCARTDAC